MSTPARHVADRRDAASGASPDLVSVVIPARNEKSAIGATLASVLAQDVATLEVLVVDGGSTDGTPDVVRWWSARDDRVRLIGPRTASIPDALNEGLRLARGRWLVRVDAHSSIPSDYVRRAVAHLESGRYGGVGGRKDGVGRTPAGRAVAAAMGSRFGVGGSVYHHGAFARTVDHVPFGAYPVSLLREVGGWDDRLLANEDYELDYRLRRRGHLLLFDPAIRIDWECRQTIRDLFRQYRRYGRGKADVARLHPVSLSPRHLAAPLLLVAWVAALVAAPRWPAMAAALAAAYPLALSVASTATARRVRGWRAKLLVAPAFVAMHVGWGLGFWEGLLHRRRRIRS